MYKSLKLLGFSVSGIYIRVRAQNPHPPRASSGAIVTCTLTMSTSTQGYGQKRERPGQKHREINMASVSTLSLSLSLVRYSPSYSLSLSLSLFYPRGRVNPLWGGVTPSQSRLESGNFALSLQAVACILYTALCMLAYMPSVESWFPHSACACFVLSNLYSFAFFFFMSNGLLLILSFLFAI